MKNYLLWSGLLAAGGLAYWQRKTLAETGSKIMSTLTRSQYVQKFAPVAKMAAKGTGLFPSVFMAQAILESNNGNSTLAFAHNNHFGIKADKSWKGKIAMMKTREVIGGKEVYVDAPFRKYDTPQASFMDRVMFLESMPRYTNAGVFTAKTPEAQAQALQKAGYATDPKYSELLIKLINQNSLKQYDV